MLEVELLFLKEIDFCYRYTQPPNELFEWFEEYLDDTEVSESLGAII
jgi:hypothetical protein